MTDEELLIWLRKPYGDAVMERAADRIEELTAKLEEFRHALLWCSGSADFNEGGVARKGWLKVCAPLLKGESHDV